MTRPEVAKLVAVLIASFPSAKPSPQTSQVYEDMLSDLEHGPTNAAIKRLISTARFMPTIGEIRGAVLEAQHGPQRPGGEAWGDVIAAVHKFGVYRTPVFDDPQVERAVKALGWTEICNSENQVADRARFIETYNALSTNIRRELVMPPDVRRISAPDGASDLRALIDQAMRHLPSGDDPS